MGTLFSRKYIKTQQVVMIGLDSAGKTTLLYKTFKGVLMETSPTIGFNVVTLELNRKTALTIWDIGGQWGMRNNWKYHLEDCSALVFVVDASDRSRIREAKNALKKIMNEPKMPDVPFMVLANKSDLPNAMTISEMSTQLNMQRYEDRLWEMQPCSALQGLGLQNAFLSVARLIKRNHKRQILKAGMDGLKLKH